MPVRPVAVALAAEQVRGVVDDEERGEARGDLAEVAAGGPHRVAPEALVERRPIVEVDRAGEDEVRLRAEGLADAPDAGRAQPRRVGDERQVLAGVAPLERLERVVAALGTAVEDEER